nr:bacteriohopanetetrol glucosamine biosynthesis glycosyltransferase HpnI [Polymorphobacter sp.]
MIVAIAAAVLIALAVAGIGYQLVAAIAVWRALAPGPTPVWIGSAPSVTLLKPLYGAEPLLAANLGSFLEQDYGGRCQVVCGVSANDDAAIGTVDSLRTRCPAGIDLVVDNERHGSNAKVSNLVNMMGAAKHDILIVSDSDIAVGPDYLARVVGALALPGVGAVTCLYYGRGDAGGWSKLAAQGISYGFLPSVIVGVQLGLAKPCMGSTIALRRETLDAIGGFKAFTEILADDHAIGVAVRVPGLDVAVPPFTVAHGCVDESLPALMRHELRWNATIRRLDAWGYLGNGLVNPLPFAVAAAAVHPLVWPVIPVALLARALVAASVDRATASKAAPWWWLPARDFLTFGLFIAGFVVQSVDWRGSRLKVARDGRISG